MPETHDTPSRIERLIVSPFVRSTYASLVGHVAALVMLGLCSLPLTRSTRPRPIVIGAAEGSDTVDATPAMDVLDMPAALAAADFTVVEVGPETTRIGIDLTGQAGAGPDADSGRPDNAANSQDPVPAPIPAGLGGGGGGYSRRQGDARRAAAAARGGSAASEAAVDRGLAWLALHQAVDGSWRFDLSGCRCDGGCRDAGSVTSTTAATGLALLPFLGAGHTQQLEGPYRETVSRGLYYLMSRLRPTPRGGDLSEGTMYGHGVATIALAEALGMTRDAVLVPYVRDAVRFVETAQDAHGGGWRYLPGQAGDMTVTAWQLAALRSAALAGMPVPSPTIEGIRRFLDRVQTQHGEAYGYQSPHPRPCTSAIGLLCRLYTHWPNEKAIDRGLYALAKPGPVPDAVYLNFYLAQALLQRDHHLWQKWNTQNRDQLVARQERHGHEAGSWFFADRETSPGGRLAHTALAVLTLEVYYRLLPIYGPDAVAADW